MKHISLITVVFALIFSVAGCGQVPDVGHGGVEVVWTIGGSTCSASGIALVEISLINKEGVQTSNTAACQVGRLVLDQVPEGTYEVRVDGLMSDSALPIYEAFVDSVKVKAGKITEVPKVFLAEKPGAIDLTWKFHDGSLCSFSGVDAVMVTVWDSHSNRIFNESLPCDPTDAIQESEATHAGSSFENTNTKGYVISNLYAGTYTVQTFGVLSGLDTAPLYWAEQIGVETQHGSITPVDLVLMPCDGHEICE